MIYNVVSSKNSGIKDPRILMWEYTLPEFLKYAEYVEIMDACEMASNKDQEQRMKQNKP